MHQIKRLCNELIKKGIVDKDTEVNVEVAGEINSASYRKALSMWQKEQKIIRDWARNEIINTYPKECRHEINPSNTDIVKFIFGKNRIISVFIPVIKLVFVIFLVEKPLTI